ncbi:MAG: AMP-dependent synthetase and ligase [Proteobacteria bacterium]|nr:AMP-dependent synthetase and ligase [Pseudomonadota bacterium]
MSTLPLLGHASLDEIFAYRPSGPRRVRDFLADAQALADRLPPNRHLLNVCQDRYHFAVGLAGGLLRGKTSLQPSSQSAETLRQVKLDCPDVLCLCDSNFDSLDLPRLNFPELSDADPQRVTAIPHIPADHPAVRVYTSGTSGQPTPHGKSWRSLVKNGRAAAHHLGSAGHCAVGTVPAQHMYGFESTILLALHGNTPFWSGKPFYAQDIVAALQAVPAPRLLVTTPFHLSALLAAGLDLPAVDLLLSATAPLSSGLAREAEKRLAAPLYEIYGCTETGQIASRRTTADLTWKLLDAIHLEQGDGQSTVFGGHVEGRVVLSDVIERLDAEHFLLHGRHADLINIAGKRTSLAYLNHQVAAIPGVTDGAFFQPDEETPDGITRLAAFVVAPGLNRRELLAALRQRVDSIFLPRPLIFVDRLPRNATGKLPREQLQTLYSERNGHACH